MSLQLSTPAFLNPGLFISHILWDSSLSDYSGYPWDTVNFTLLIESSHPTVIEISPSEASFRGGDPIRVFVTGFPPAVHAANFRVSFGDLPCTLLSEPYGDILGTYISFSSPVLAPGLKIFGISYNYSTESIFEVSSHLYITTDEIALNCLAGCTSRVGTKSTVASLKLELGQTQKISLDANTRIRCRFVSGQSQNNCSVWNAIFGPWSPCADRPTSNCTEIRVQYGIEYEMRSYLITPLTSAYLSIASSDILLNSLVAPVQLQRAPAVSSAEFSSNWALVLISFDQSVSISQLPGCSLILNPIILGSSATCMWRDNMNFVIMLGIEPAILPGDSLILSAKLSDVTSLAWTVEPQRVVIGAPSVVQAPQIFITGPDVISQCDLAEIQATASSSRNTFSWGCVNDRGLDAAVSNYTGPVLSMNGSTLQVGKSYYITVKLKTYYGIWSPTVTHLLLISASPVPIVTINLPSPPYERSADIYLESSAIFSRCSTGSTSLQFQWTISTDQIKVNNTGANAVIQSTDPVLFIPAYTLGSGQSYKISLSVGMGGQLAVTALKQMTIQREKVIARVAGGNPYVQEGSTVNLDASQSVDPNRCPNPSLAGACDSTRFLDFVWGCFIGDSQPCRFKNGSLAIFQRAAKINMNLSLLNIPTRSNIKFTITVSNSDTSDQQSVYVGLSPYPVAKVQISLVYLTASRVAYYGTAEGLIQALNWSITSSSGSSDAALDTSDPTTFITGTSGQQLVVRLDTPAASVLFRPGATYRVTLNVISSAGHGMSWLALSIPLPPTGGVCSVSPLKGSSISTDFAVACKDWQGSFMPLVYSFSVRLASVIDPMDTSVTWSPPSSSEQFTTYLPDGNFSLAAMIIDAQGFFTVVSPALIQVRSVDNRPPDVQAVSSLFSKFNLQAQTTQVLMLVDSLASNINSAPGACASSACRRLLGSSSAYRIALRRLLLRALSGSLSSRVSSRTAPTLLKSVKRAASVPSELDLDSIQLAQNQFSSFQQLDLRVLQSGAIVDVIKLSRNLIRSAVPIMETDPLAAFNVQMIHSILQLSLKYWLGMVPGENPLEVKLKELSLSVVQTFTTGSTVVIYSSDDLTNTSRRAAVSTAVDVGGGIVRLSPSLASDSSAATGVLPSEVVGVSVWGSLLSSKSDVAWICPDSSMYCVRLGFVFAGDFQDYNISCLRWSGSSWINASCTAQAEDIGTEGGQAFAVNCSCGTDGIFKAAAVPKKVPAEPVPFQSAVMFDNLVFSSWSAVTVAAVMVTLSVTSGSIFYLIYGRVRVMDAPSAQAIMRKWFETETPKRRRLRPTREAPGDDPGGSGTGVTHAAGKMEVSPSVTSELCFPLRPVHLESVLPPIMFLDD